MISDAALVAIEIVALVGFFLVMGGLTLGRWIARKNPKLPQSRSITAAGIVVYGLFVLFLFAGLAAKYWAPGTWLADWTSTSEGRWLYVIGLAIAGTLVERVLYALGIPILAARRRGDADDQSPPNLP